MVLLLAEDLRKAAPGSAIWAAIAALLASTPALAQDVIATHPLVQDSDRFASPKRLVAHPQNASATSPIVADRSEAALPVSVAGSSQVVRSPAHTAPEVRTSSWADGAWSRSAERKDRASYALDRTGRSDRAEGIRLIATVKAQTVDAAAPDHLINGPTGSPFDEAVGLGWRRNNLSAMVGYMRPDDRPAYQDEGVAYRHARPRVGIGLSLHY